MKKNASKSKGFGCLLSYNSSMYYFCLKELIVFFTNTEPNVDEYFPEKNH